MTLTYASWSVLTMNFLVVLHLALGGVALAALLHLVNARWRFEIRYLSSSLFVLFPLAFVLLLVLLLNGAKTFPWVGSPAAMPGWNNFPFLAAREILAFLGIGALYGLFIKYQAVALQSAAQARTFRNIALLIPFAHVMFCTMVAWDFEMTLTPGWASAIYGMYHMVGSFGMMLSVLVLSLMLLMRNRSLTDPPGEHIFNYIAQLMLAFTILWVYTFFAQYLIIWYANLPDETGRLFGMQNGPFSTYFWLFFVLRFVIPFPILLFPYARHSRAVIAFVATSIITGYLVERYTWIAAAVPGTPQLVSPFGIVSSVVVFGAAILLVRGAMKKYGLMKASRTAGVALRNQAD